MKERLNLFTNKGVMLENNTEHQCDETEEKRYPKLHPRPCRVLTIPFFILLLFTCAISFGLGLCISYIVKTL